jgi:hypothetical protein
MEDYWNLAGRAGSVTEVSLLAAIRPYTLPG